MQKTNIDQKDKLQISMSRCRGIGKLEVVFKFKPDHRSACVIYAPNGVMKTSFASTLDNFSKGKGPEDKLSSDEKSTFEIKFNGTKLDPKQILAIVGEDYLSTIHIDENSLSTLLVEKEQKEMYESFHKVIANEVSSLLAAIADATGIDKKNTKSEVCSILGIVEKEFENSLGQLLLDPENEIPQEACGNYKVLFSSEVIDKISDPTVLSQVDQFATKYLELLENTDLYSKDFTPYGMNQVSTSISKNKFLSKTRKLIFSNKTIETQKELDDYVNEQRAKVIGNDELKSIFSDMEKKLSGNEKLRSFSSFISEHRDLIPLYQDIIGFKRSYILSSLVSIRPRIESVLEVVKSEKDDIERILVEANNSAGAWESIVGLYNSRFPKMPFSVAITNKADAVVGTAAPAVSFKIEGKEVTEDLMMQVLSTGEKRVLNLLDQLFKIENAKRSATVDKPVFIVLDDVVDSYDYRNKYAFIEYLCDLDKALNVCLVILTHNFDFYRTSASRLGTENVYFAVKNKENEVKLEKGNYLHDIYNHFSKNIGKTPFFIASIPLVRNLIEIKDKTNNDYETLTELVHVKTKTKRIKVCEIKEIFKKHWKLTLSNCEFNDDELVYDLILKASQEIATSDAYNIISLENKIVLAMASRLLAEEFLLSKLRDPVEVCGIRRNQTRELYNLAKANKVLNYSEYSVIDRVIVSTSECIHINAFMFEPLMDISTEELVDCFKAVSTLKGGVA